MNQRGQNTPCRLASTAGDDAVNAFRRLQLFGDREENLLFYNQKERDEEDGNRNLRPGDIEPQHPANEQEENQRLSSDAQRTLRFANPQEAAVTLVNAVAAKEEDNDCADGRADGDGLLGGTQNESAGRNESAK